MQTTTVILVLLLGITTTVQAQNVFFTTPIAGVQGRDFFIVNYVDHDPEAGRIIDHACGTKTYDGHQGTDFVLRSFGQMDSGTAVLTAADGIVFAALDTLYDRNKTSVIERGFGNWIGIAHEDGILTYYAHIRTGSAIVQIGDTVTAGQQIALVGSSGNSTDPHLHFEVWTTDTVLIDPFSIGACNEWNSGYWQAELPYDSSFALIDHGMMNWAPTLDTLRERIVMPVSFAPPDTAVAFWAHMHGLRKDDISTIEWYNSQNELWFSYEFPALAQNAWYYYFWSYINLPPAGEWYVLYYRNGVLVTEQDFVVEGTTDVAYSSMPNMASGIRIRYLPERGGTITVSFPDTIGPECSLVLFNNTGQQIATLYSGSQELAPREFTLDNLALPDGMYYLRTTTGKAAATFPLPIVH